MTGESHPEQTSARSGMWGCVGTASICRAWSCRQLPGMSVNPLSMRSSNAGKLIFAERGFKNRRCA